MHYSIRISVIQDLSPALAVWLAAWHWMYGWLAAWHWMYEWLIALLTAGHWLYGGLAVWLPDRQAAFSAGSKSAYHVDILPYQLAISLVAPQTWSQTLELRLIPSMRMYDSRSALPSELMTGRHADLIKTYLIEAAKPELPGVRPHTP